MTYGHRPQGLALPGWILFVRLAQAFLALLVVILTAVAAAKLLSGADVQFLVDAYPGFGFAWFAFSWTVVYLPVTTFLIPSLAPKFKPIVIILVLELLSTLWWLVAFALLADDSRKMGLWVNDPDFAGYFDAYKASLGMTQASAALGAIEFVLFAVCSGVIIASLIRKHGSNAHQADGTVIVDGEIQQYPKEVAPPPTAAQLP